VVAVGCLVQRYKDELAAEIPEVDLFLGLTEMQGLVPELRAGGLLPGGSPGLPNMERPLRILSTDTPHTSFLKISEGCDHTCAFCAIPHMRGLHRSAPLDELVREARELEARGSGS
jgi:ribosomal protein S12 methylthiotransferase